MKIILLFRNVTMLLSFLILSFASGATTYTINVQEFAFSPNNISVNVGDTIKWKWINGVHTTTSISVPAGAAMWDHPINSTNPSFMYKITEEGNYHFKCTPHFGMGMVGLAVASNPVGIGSNESDKSEFVVFPNPFSSIMKLNFRGFAEKNVRIEVFDAIGKRVYSDSHVIESRNQEIAIPFDMMKSGMYFVSAILADKQKYVVKVLKN